MAKATIKVAAPYWLDYLCRERTMCSVCKATGLGDVRIGDPIPAGLSHHGLAAYRTRQRAAYRRHVAENHPTLRVRWAR